MLTREYYVRYVSHHRVLDYLLCGWMVAADLGPTHGEYRVLMSWLCNCSLTEPNNEQTKAHL